VLVAALFLVPGWLWLRRAGVDPVIALYAGPAMVVLAGALFVALGVVLPWSVRVTCVGGLVIVVMSAVWCALTAPRPLAPARGEFAGVIAFLLAFAALAAFAAPPSDPYGSWSDITVGPGRVDTPRWPSLAADNTLPFRTGQVALFKQGGEHIRDAFSPGWWLSDRTPLTGLDFAFAAGALGVHVSSINLEAQPSSAVAMTFKDRFGFWAYQLVAMMLNIAIVLGVYLLARVWLGRRIATVSALVAAVLPGLFLNAVYTWPKEAIGYFALVAAACALRRRPVLAGVGAGLGYLAHPAGVFWVLPLALMLLADDQLRARAGHTLLRFFGAAVALAAPWLYFTSEVMHATSRWTTAPLGYLMTDPRHLGAQLADAWHFFTSHGLFYALWVRAQSTAGSLFPLDFWHPLPSAPYGYRTSALFLWSVVHGFSIWGMVGMVLFPFAIVVLAREWPTFRTLTLRLVVPALVLVELGNGLSYPFANQSMFPLVGLLAIVVGVGLLAATRRARLVLLAIAGIELLSLAYGSLYRPYNISLTSAATFTAIAVISQIALLTALAGQLDLLRWRPQPSIDHQRSPRIPTRLTGSGSSGTGSKNDTTRA
jgi:hypothetical protein